MGNLYNRFINNKNKQIESYKNCIDSLNEAYQNSLTYLNQEAYLYEFEYNREYTKLVHIGNEVHKYMSNPISFVQRIIYGLNLLKKQYDKIYADYREMTSEFNQQVMRHNRLYMDNAVAKAYKSIGDVEGRPLDRQQMECIVKNPHNQLVIAGAGTGKTTTIIGKVKFLLSNKLCNADEICVLSFTNAAATEMKNRLYAETQEEIHVSTFHSLGMDILRTVDKKKPSIYSDGMHQFVLTRLEEHLKQPEYAKLLMTYLLFSRVQAKSEFDFKDKKSYEEYLETNPPTTIRGERVKSYGEMEIANLFCKYGIRYQYEADYTIDTRTEAHGQYRPDFYLPDYNIYVEYYGINRKNEVPSYFQGKDGKSASELYLERIEWKRKTHQENNTTLVECYAYEKLEGSLLDRLEERLRELDVAFEEVNLEQLFKSMGVARSTLLDGIATSMQTVINLAKGKRISPDMLINLCSGSDNNQKTLAQLIAPIMIDYEQYLRENSKIDFTDMLNLAEDYVKRDIYHHHYKYVIVDEYQDLSSGQYRMLDALRNDKDYTLFCVGDDWQSIYRFNGSDIGYILNFSKYWGDAEISRIETTYRFSQRLIDISGSFVMNNPYQIKKSIKAGKDTEKLVLGEICAYKDTYAIKFMVERLFELPQNSSVYFIGRYKFDAELLKNDERLSVFYDNAKGNVRVRLASRTDLDDDV